MKTLSIIGIVMSLLAILVSLAIIDIRCYGQWGTDQPGVIPGVLNLMISMFFLAFSIVACIIAFRKKKH